MKDNQHETIYLLNSRIKDLERKIEEYESGKRYVEIMDNHARELRAVTESNRILEKKLTEANEKNTLNTRKYLKSIDETVEDVSKEYEKRLAAKDTEIKSLKERIIEVERQRDEALKAIANIKKELNEKNDELADANGKIVKLTAEKNKNYENSSKPSSTDENHSKIPNSRESTGKSQGGQTGHVGYKRPDPDPTQPPILLSPPEKVLDNPDFVKTGRIISKKMVNIHIETEVIELQAEEYYNPKTGETCHAEFPNGYVNELNYGGTVKALAYILNNECDVSIDKTRRLICELSDGKVNISKGMVNHLGMELFKKTKEERDNLFKSLSEKPILHIDNTHVRCNGEGRFVFVVATPEGEAQYYHRMKKGHEGVKGTPVEENVGATLIHDHDSTFYNYGFKHQECLSHLIRYCLGSMQNESHLTWNKQMHSLLQEMIHYKKSGVYDEAMIRGFEKRYDDILKTAEKEYTKHPPTKYYMEGYNLYIRSVEYKESHLRFLHEPQVPFNNNLAERLLRNIKRKLHQVMTFRSDVSIEQFCNGLTLMQMAKRDKDSPGLHKQFAKYFDR